MGKFRPSNRVVFIGGCDSPHPTLALYKTYTITDTYFGGKFIDVVDDDEVRITYEASAFVFPSEFRTMKLLKLKEKCSK